MSFLTSPLRLATTDPSRHRIRDPLQGIHSRLCAPHSVRLAPITCRALRLCHPHPCSKLVANAFGCAPHLVRSHLRYSQPRPLQPADEPCTRLLLDVQPLAQLPNLLAPLLPIGRITRLIRDPSLIGLNSVGLPPLLAGLHSTHDTLLPVIARALVHDFVIAAECARGYPPVLTCNLPVTRVCY